MRLLWLLMRGYSIETIRLALALVECQHPRAIDGDNFCGDCGRRLRVPH